MALDFQIEPFFDDYSEDKKFHKILFRPSYAVQARELTQLQTILQEQIRRHGDHMFKEGSMIIPGQIAYDLNVNYVKLVTSAGVNSEAVLQGLLNKEIKNSAGLQAKVIKYSLAEGNDPNTLYIKYLNTIQVLGNNVVQFAPGDLLTPVDGTPGLSTVVADEVVGDSPPIGKASIANIQRGIYYIKKHFVLVQEQSIILDKYSNTPSYRVGLELSEDIIYPENDESLLDNALGSPNYAAPGAARYYIDLILSKISLESNSDENFIDLLRLKDGKVLFKIDKTQYAEIEKTLARRTYDESGDYSLAPFGIQIREYRNNLRGEWAGTTRYIQGDIIRVPSGLGFNYFTAVTNGTSDGNTPSWSTSAPIINDGSTLKWEYTIVPKFNQGIHSFPSTAYTNFTENDHIRLSGMLAIGVEPSKAYVKGYEIEKLVTEYIPVTKSRDLPAGSEALSAYFGVDSLPASTSALSQDKTSNIDVSMGSYIIVKDTAFAPDLVTLPEISLYGEALDVSPSTTPPSGGVIGTARVRAVEIHETGKYKLFLFDIKMSVGKNISEVKSIWTSGTAFRCNTHQEGTPLSTILYNPERSSLIYNLPDYAIKEVSEVTYTVVRSYNITSSGTGTTSLTVPSSEYSFDSINNVQNYIAIKNNTADGVAGGTYTNLTSSELSIVSGALNITGLANSTAYTILATLKRTDSVNAFSKVQVEDQTDTFTTSPSAVKRTLTLTKPYAIRIVSIKMDPNGFQATPSYTLDVTSRYIFNNGQTNTGINLSEISLVEGAPLPSGALQVIYEHLNITEVTSGDFLCVNSYTHSTSEMRYDQIGAFGRQQLRDCIDFRPYYSGGTYAQKFFPKFGTTASFKYKHYLPRVDNLSLSQNGQYIVSQGIPSLSALEPSMPDNSMKLARLNLEPYTFTTSERSVAVDRVENKRYTMRDIGKLERRIQDLEYYTSLSLLEMETKNTNIIDSNGLDRLQNGFIVDTFDGQGVGNAASSEWNASIDSTRKELRPFFSQKQVNLLENVLATTKNYVVSGDIVTLPYTETNLIQQLKASRAENVNPYALYSWNGIVTLNPWSDTWFSTERRPDVILNDEGQYNAIVAKAEQDGVLGTVWNSWQTVFSSTRSLASRLEKLAAWSTANNEILNDTNNGGTFWRNRATFTTEELAVIGVTDGNLSGDQAAAAAGTRVLTVETEAVETTSSRAGTRTFIVDKVDSRVLEDRVIETKIVPYIRSRAILFSGFGFRPDTELYSFFDGVNVDSYITPATKIKINRVQKQDLSYYPHTFDVTRNAGSAVQDAPRLVTNNGTEDVEIAFNHGEIIKEYISGVATGTTAVVVGQEVIGSDYFIYVMNIKGGSSFSTASGSYLEGEYLVSGDKPRIKFVENLGGSAGRLKVSGTGMINGIFRIPNDPINKFRTGTRELKFTNSDVNIDTNANTRGSSLYEANGLIEVKQRTILSTRTADIVSTQISETNTVVTTNDRITRDTGWFDPLAQTFLVQQEGGAFITSVEVYFSTVDTNVPVRVEIREVVNGYPGSRVLPFSRVEKKGSSITTSADASAATKFRFTSPVYLQNGIEYALVVLSDSNNYRVWVSQTEEIDVTPGANLARINSQPYNGVLFKSQNGTAWTADQTQDLKFKINRAQFSTTPVEIELIPPTLGYKNLDFNPFNFILINGSSWSASGSSTVTVTCANHGLSNGNNVYVNFTSTSGTNATSGYYIVAVTNTNVFTLTNSGGSITGAGTAEVGSKKIRVRHRDHGMIVGDKVKFVSRQVVSSINGIPESEIFGVEHVIQSTGIDDYVIQVASTTSNASGRTGGAYIAATENFEYQTAMIDIAQTTVPGCTIEYTLTNINSSDVLKTYAVTPLENIAFEENKVLPSSLNYTGNGLVVKAKLSSNSSAVSPVIDVGRMAMTMVSNKINNPSVNDNDPQLDIVSIANSTEIGSGKPITRTSNTISASSLTDLDIYNSLNSLSTGNIIRVIYSGVSGVNYFEVVDKYYSSTNIFIELEPYDSTSILSDTGVAQTANIAWMSHYNTESSNGLGSVTSKYVTKKINLSRPSEMLRVVFAGMIPSEADIEVYYKVGLNASGDFEASGYRKAELKSLYTKSSTEFSDITFDVEDLQPFDTFIVKLAMRSSNKSAVPRIKDLRVIACAA